MFFFEEIWILFSNQEITNIIVKRTKLKV